MMDEAIIILKEQVGITTQETDWSFESVTAEREELDPTIIKVTDTDLPKLVLTHLYLYVDQRSGNDYVVYFITDTTSGREFTRGLLIEGKLHWYSNGESHD
ncbi:4'-phosphopantetheinyl transferase [Enterococcus hulanensis]|uniref:4'-phosphopantetheinyl transferase n=1 Tax=Enterococcus hulanensis TaxID=2559929 RepID=UPI00288E01AB|nr:4'-phosphopantetheinyl transferase [Enterococcus hulanensis]MDT2659235.1 4'-phosphopantetheinyl transferase [Enterococcus hulanensis]